MGNRKLCKEDPMAEERDLTHDPISGQGTHAADQARQVAEQGTQAAALSPGDRPEAAYPSGEAEYWREIYSREPYYEEGRTSRLIRPMNSVGPATARMAASSRRLTASWPMTGRCARASPPSHGNKPVPLRGPRQRALRGHT
jgi:hypothetical protein